MGKQKTPCKFFASGKCQRANCKFSHDINKEDIPVQTTTEYKKSSLKKKKKQQKCSTCKKTSTTLVQLQFQTDTGIECLDKITLALGALHAQVETIRTNLENTKSDVKDAIDNIENDESVPSSILPPLPQVMEQSNQVRDTPSSSRPSPQSIDESRENSTPSQYQFEKNTREICTATSSKDEADNIGTIPSSGFQNIMKSSTPTNTTVEGVISAYVSGTPDQYIKRLCTKLNVSAVTPSDLVSLMTECLVVLKSMSNGTASETDCLLHNAVLGVVRNNPKDQEEFCKALLSAAAASTSMNPAELKQEDQPNVVTPHSRDPSPTDEVSKGVVHETVSPPIAIQRTMGRAVSPLGLEQHEQFPPLSPQATPAVLIKTTTQSKASSVAANKRLSAILPKEFDLSATSRIITTNRVETNKQKSTKSELGKESMGDEKKASMELESIQDVVSKEEPARLAEDSCSTRAKLSIPVSNKSTVLKQTKQATRTDSSIHVAKQSLQVVVSKATSKESPPSQQQVTSKVSRITTGGRAKTKPTLQRQKKANDMTGNRLSSYIKNSPKAQDDSVSPIFQLLQNQDTLDHGRKLLHLEEKAQQQRNCLSELQAKRAAEERKLNKIESAETDFKESWEETSKGMKHRIEELEKIATGEDVHLEKKDKLANLTERLLETAALTAASDSVPNSLKPSEKNRKRLQEFGNRTAARELNKEVKDESLGYGKIYEKKKREREENLSNQKIAILELQQKIESGDKAATHSDDGGTKWRTARYELKKQVDELSEQLEADMAAAEEIEKNVIKRREKAQKEKDDKMKSAADKAEGLRTQLAVGEERIKQAPNKIQDQKDLVEAFDPKIEVAKSELDATRELIQGIKGSGKYEDTHFDINGSKDERGHTFLMVCAQNDDVTTAKICLDMGADISATNPEGLCAIDYSYFFEFDSVTELIVQHLASVSPMSAESSVGWNETLLVSKSAAKPAEQYIEQPKICEEDEEKRMHILSENDRRTDFSCFEARLLDQNDQFRRVVLLDQAVYSWICSADKFAVNNFIEVIEGLRPIESRRDGVAQTLMHRRAIVGTKSTFEVLAADIPKSDKVMLFTPFVEGETNGVSNVGILVWTITHDSEASMYRTLIENTEFLRHKVKMDDRFLAHKDSVLELGRDMHLLDLHSTSIWTTTTMGLYVLNVDEGDLVRLIQPGFNAKKRVVHSEEMVNRALFQTSGDELKKNDGLLASERKDLSSLIYGGAGVGKTLLMIRKVSQEHPSRRILVVSRLQRLVKIIKTAVEEKRSDKGIDNVTFFTYDELLQQLARAVIPDEESQQQTFINFDRVYYDCDNEGGKSFYKLFVSEELSNKEREQMTAASIEPLVLWFAIITIKSPAQCAATKMSLTRDEYLSLPASYGLNNEQRELCYELYIKYEVWREDLSSWDEIDRVRYVLSHGPITFREETFVPWAERVHRNGDMSLLDQDGNPLHPFCFDMVCSDEAQDFTELDIALFIRMSNIRSVFLNSDPAQSVELGVKARPGTVNDVFYSEISDNDKTNVNDVLQEISLMTNHRTHAENLAIGQATRKILARSFKVPITQERALIKGKTPKTLRIKEIDELANIDMFKGGNVVFLAPDEKVSDLKLIFHELGIKNDLFGVREAKGLEFDAVALINFYGYIEEKGSSTQWKNALRWLSSTSGITETNPTGEKVGGIWLADCDYQISHPEVGDEAMLCYTAITRARSQLYLIEADGMSQDIEKKLFYHLVSKEVSRIEKDHEEKAKTPAKHKAEGVLLITQAKDMIRRNEPFNSIRSKLIESSAKFSPSLGNDQLQLKKCEGHLKALDKRKESRSTSLADFAFRTLSDHSLAKVVSCIDEGQEEMTAAQHKTRGVEYVTIALDMLRRNEPFDNVRKKLNDAASRFTPTMGNDQPLLKQCKRHLRALEMKREISRYAKQAFFVSGKYHLEGRFAEVLSFQEQVSKFFASYIGDSFLIDEVKEVRHLVEDIFFGTRYEFRFSDVCATIESLEKFV